MMMIWRAVLSHMDAAEKSRWLFRRKFANGAFGHNPIGDVRVTLKKVPKKYKENTSRVYSKMASRRRFGQRTTKLLNKVKENLKE